jgi:hypothetical protein
MNSKDFARKRMRNLMIASVVLLCVTSVGLFCVIIFEFNQQINSMFIPQSSSATLLISSEILSLILSVLSLFLVILACLSLIRVSICLLRFNAILLLFMFLCGTGASIFYLVQINNTYLINSNLVSEFTPLFQSNANPFYSDYFQINFKCCGK